MDLDYIRNILETDINRYTYGKSDIFKKNLTIDCNNIQKRLRINDFYDFGKDITTGTCSELMNSAYHNVKNRLKRKCRKKKIRVIRAIGHDNRYFTHDYSSHCFLLLSYKDLLKNKDTTNNPREIKKITEKDPILIDPSFKKICMFKESGYKTTILISETCKIPSNNNYRILEKNNSTPLCISSDDEIVCLTVDFKLESILGIKFLTRDSPLNKIYPIDSDKLDKKIQNDSITQKYIEYFRNIDINHTTEYLGLY